MSPSVISRVFAAPRERVFAAPRRRLHGGRKPGRASSDAENKVMQMWFRIGDTLMMASDGPSPGRRGFGGFSLALTARDDAEAERLFASLAEGGQVAQPRVVVDHFGVSWRIVVAPQKEIVMSNPVVHWELMSKDPAKVSDFYAEIFGWKVEHRAELNYRIVDTGGEGGINGGIVKPEREGPWPGNMLFYVAVDDLAAYRKKVVAAGGKICVEEQQVPGMGSFCLFTDPEGRMMGLWKSGGSS